jgi:hypothetical protein
MTARTIQKRLTYPILALSSTVIWGLIELVALNRFRRTGK